MATEITIETRRLGKGPISRLSRADVIGILEVLLAEVIEGISRRVTITGEAYGPTDADYAAATGRTAVSLARTGALIRSAQVGAKNGRSGNLQFTVPYARFLQLGTRHMRARPFNGYTIESARLVTRQAAKVVQRKILRKRGTSQALSNAAGELAIGVEGDGLALDAAGGGLAL